VQRQPPNKDNKTAPLGPCNCLEGVTIVISGILDSMERTKAEGYIQRHGGEVASALTSHCVYT